MQTESAKHLSESIPPGLLSSPRRKNRRRPRWREKIFGFGKPHKLDRNVRARLAHAAEAAVRPDPSNPTKKRLSRTAKDVLRSLLFDFANCKDGRCFPGYKTIAKAVGCSYSAVARAIAELEARGFLTWVNRLFRRKEPSTTPLGLPGQQTRVFRASNVYRFGKPPQTSESQKETRTTKQQEIPYDKQKHSTPIVCSTELQASLDRWREGVTSRHPK